MKHGCFIFLSLSLLTSLSSCSSSLHYKDNCYSYDTFWTFHTFEGKQSDLDQIKNRVLSTSRVFDRFAEGFEKGVASLNKNREMDVDPLLADILRKAEEIREYTKGAYNPYCGDLKDLWNEYLSKKEIPSEEAIKPFLEKAKQASIIIEDNHVSLNGDFTIDLGAIAKGYCTELLKQDLKDRGIGKYVINGGNSSIIVGENPNDGEGRTIIEIEDLPGKRFYAKNESISTSSCSKQLYEVGGIHYSHIIDMDDGSALATYDAVIVRNDNACFADALSTALYTMSLDEIKEYDKDGTKILVIDNGEVIYHSHDFVLE